MRFIERKEMICSSTTLFDVLLHIVCSPNRLFGVHFTAVFQGGSSYPTCVPAANGRIG